MRPLWFALCLVSAACGSVVEPPKVACGPGTCTGCCQGGTCLAGTSDSACGRAGEQCADCGSSRVCTNATCEVEPLPVGAKVVFVTRTTFKGNLGGLVGADRLCEGAAGAGSLPGRFKAWLSTNEWDSTRRVAVYVHAADRFVSNGPWYLPGVNERGRRMQVFTSRAALRSAPLIPIDRTELGTNAGISPGGRNVFTGTQATGMSLPISSFAAPQSTCSNWTSSSSGVEATIGTVYGQGGDWTARSDSGPCANDLSLYCFED
ncbi:MAG: DUF1554 domain-containing protein [Myxococcales bacterium]|nr:DUF1554 domain-containing protein [Myxococcales bacterium]